MGEFSERRRGFGGQTLTVTKMGESQLLGNQSRDKSLDIWTFGALNDILDRALKDPSFVHIRLIDEYGTTFFSPMQLKEVVPELQRLLAFTNCEEEAEIVQDIVDLAREIRDDVHKFLVFLGD
jgi:hypothetical protein